jgi:hypothetical protein
LCRGPVLYRISVISPAPPNANTAFLLRGYPFRFPRWLSVRYPVRVFTGTALMSGFQHYVRRMAELRRPRICTDKVALMQDYAARRDWLMLRCVIMLTQVVTPLKGGAVQCSSESSFSTVHPLFSESSYKTIHTTLSNLCCLPPSTIVS